MLHPSYSDLMKVVNSGVEEGETPIVNSRYSIVLATSKRARQIIAGDEPLVEKEEGRKALSYAVEELETGKIRILGSGEENEEEMMQTAFPVTGGNGYETFPENSGMMEEFDGDEDEVFDEDMMEEFDEPIPEEFAPEEDVDFNELVSEEEKEEDFYEAAPGEEKEEDFYEAVSDEKREDLTDAVCTEE